MDINTAIVLGVWIFAAATVITKNVAGWFTFLSFIMAIALSFILK